MGASLSRARAAGASRTVVRRAEPEAATEAPAPASAEVLSSRYAAWQAKPEWQDVTPTPFKLQEGYLGRVAGASVGGLATLLVGAFGPGYSPSLARLTDDQKAGRYFLPVSPAGVTVQEESALSSFPRPAQPLILYEFQGCPFCRKVRNAVSALGLDVLVRPCPSGGATWRPEAIAKGGKRQFPYLIDPNPEGGEVAMYESDDIIAYLFRTYGPGDVPTAFAFRNGAILNSLGLLGRMGAGSRAKPALMPPQPLQLWAYEPSPFCVVVKEVLCAYEIPYVQHSCPRGSPKRQELFERVGHFQAPYLEDPNTGAAMFESAQIISYLEDVYAA